MNVAAVLSVAFALTLAVIAGAVLARRQPACTCVTPWPTIRVRTRRGFETRCQVCEGKK